MAERIAYLLIPAYCSPPTTNRTGEVRLDEMGPCLGTAGLVLMAVLASSSAALAAGNPSAGQTVFASHCAVCHSTQSGVKSRRRSPALSAARAARLQVRFLTGDEGCKHHLGRQQFRQIPRRPARLHSRDQDVHQSPQRNRSAECHRLFKQAEEMSRLARRQMEIPLPLTNPK